MNKNITAVCAIAAGIGLLPLPYAYYMLLRLLFFGCLIFIGFKIYEKSHEFIAPLFIIGGLALLYNPLFPIHLGSKVAWIIINIGTIAFMFWLSEKHGQDESKTYQVNQSDT